MDLEYDPLEDTATAPLKPAVASKKISDAFLAVAERQRPFFALANQFQALFYELPDLTTRDVDVRIKAMYETCMEVCEKVGIARMSIPQLKECCGRDRVWLDEHTSYPPVQVARKGGVGDLIAKITGFLGVKPCDGCKRRQAFLNKFRWPWGK